MNKNVSDIQQNPETTEPTEQEENEDNGETKQGEASTDQNVLFQALTTLHTELKETGPGRIQKRCQESFERRPRGV